MSKYYSKSTLISEFSCFDTSKIHRPWDMVSYNGQTELKDREFLPMWVKNRYGCIRWCHLRNAYSFGYLSIDQIVDYWREWKDTREDLWLDSYTAADQYVDTTLVAAAKRGNEWYKARVNRKFDFLDNLEPVHFFCEEWGQKLTPMIFVTLTVDTKKYSLDLAWDIVSYELHLFETKLRQEYGPFVKFRVWEAHKSGYPHCHIVYYFLDRKFEVWEHFDKKKGKFNGNRTYRVANKHRDKIRGFWSMGPNVDIQGVSDTLGALSEVKKYVTKTIWSNKGDLTNAMLCLHRKQSYWISSCNPWSKVDKAIAAGAISCDVDGRSEYIAANVDKWARKDFVGVVWGSTAYLELYKNVPNGLAEPNIGALVSPILHNCNNDKPEIAYFKYRGSFLHEDLKLLAGGIGDNSEIHTIPPPEIRVYFGVDKPSFSGNKKVPRLFMEELD